MRHGPHSGAPEEGGGVMSSWKATFIAPAVAGHGSNEQMFGAK